MSTHHWIMLFVVALVFYYVGGKYPGMLARVGL
jgi:hypothetical protein